MRFVGSVISIAILSALATWFLPWWMLAVVSFIIAFVVYLAPGKAFWSGFVGIALLWLICILIKDIANEHVLSIKMAKLFSLPDYWLFILVNIIVGGLVGGLASWSGAVLRNEYVKTVSN